METTIAESSAAAAARPPPLRSPSPSSRPPPSRSPSPSSRPPQSSPIEAPRPPPSPTTHPERPDSPSSSHSLAISLPTTPLGPDQIGLDRFRHAILPTRSRTPSQPPMTPLSPSPEPCHQDNEEYEEFVPPSRSPPNLEGRPSSYQALVAYSSGASSSPSTASEGSEHPGSVRSFSSASSLSNGMRSVSVREQARRAAADRSRQIEQHPLMRQILEDGEEDQDQEGS